MAEVDVGHLAEPQTSEVSEHRELKSVNACISLGDAHAVDTENKNSDTTTEGKANEASGEVADSATNGEHVNEPLANRDASSKGDIQQADDPTDAVMGGFVEESAQEVHNIPTESLASDQDDPDGVMHTNGGSDTVDSMHGEPTVGSQSLATHAGNAVSSACVSADCGGGENSANSDLGEVNSCECSDAVILSHSIPTQENELQEKRVSACTDEAASLLDNASNRATMAENAAHGDADIPALDDRELSTKQEESTSESDLVSEDEYRSAKSDTECNGKPSAAVTLNQPFISREPTLRERLGHLKEGIKSATKDNSHILTAFGQMKLGIRSAISETSTFLEGPPTQRSRSEISGVHVHTTSSDPAVLHISGPTLSVDNAQPEPIIEEECPDVDVAAAVLAAPPVDAYHEGAGDAVMTPSDVHEDDLLSELDAELDVGCSVESDRGIEREQQLNYPIVESQLDVMELERTVPPPRPPPPNGVRRMVLTEIPEFKELQTRCKQLMAELQQQKEQHTRLLSVHEAQDEVLLRVRQEAEAYKKQIQDLRTRATSDDTVYLAQMKVLEMTIASQQMEISAAHEKFVAHDKAAKDAIAKLNMDLRTRVKQLTAVNEASKRETADMVLKYARAEAKNIEMEQKMAKNDARTKEMAKDRDAVLGKFKLLRADQIKCRELFESRSTEVVNLKNELEKQKELFISQEGKTKWAHNKLRQEIDAHKETHSRMEELQRKNKAARDEGEQIRRDCQAMIKTYQESEEIKSNSLDMELKNKETELMQHKQEKIDHQEVHNLVRRELETFKMKHKEMFEELKTWRDKVQCLDAERIIQEQNLNKYRETLQSQKETNQTLQKKLLELEQIEDVVTEVKTKSEEVELRNKDLEQECLELRADMELCKAREQEHLQFTQKISDKNARLQSENTTLANKVTGLTVENEQLEALCANLSEKKTALEEELKKETTLRGKEGHALSTQLAETTATLQCLTVELDDAHNELKTLKRKYAANTKDLTRQLQFVKRRLESVEPKDSSSMGSRTPSNGSLDTINGGRTANNFNQPQVEHESFVEIVEVDKQMLIEKIVRLQKAHARKNEKLEFMEDHIQQLFAEVQKKTKIIQNYALREEAGTLSSDSADANKALLAKKGGIMASLYTSHQQDGAMNLDLSLDINRKLQAVLEDTLLKNITLKENLDTLGEEIARLSQENRAIQLDQQT